MVGNTSRNQIGIEGANREYEVGRNARVPLPSRLDPNSYLFTAVLGLLAGLPALSIDLSAPTLPLLPVALGTSETIAGLTLSLFMVGFALGQFGAGRLSDDRGRRPILLCALVCFDCSGIGCSLAPTGPILVLLRFIQGFGAGACSVISFAMVQDLFAGDVTRAKRSYVATIFTAVPILAPAAGSALIDVFGWRSVHAVLALVGLLLSVVTWFFVGESRAVSEIGGECPHRKYSTRDFTFLRITLANALSYGVIFVYIAGSPVVIIGKMGYSSTTFAIVFACTAAALALGAWTNARLSRQGVRPAALINPAFTTSVAATAALAFASLSEASSPGVILPLLMTVLFTRGILAPNLLHLAIESRHERAGSASAVLGISQLLVGAVASAGVAAMLPAFGANAVACTMVFLAIAALVTWCWRSNDLAIAGR